MAIEGRDEMIVRAIIQKGTQKEKDIVWKYLRSISAMAEAEIINVSDVTQNKIILAIGRTKNSQLRGYDTKALIESVNKLLGKMVSDCELLSKRMVTANVLAGKVKSAFGQKTTQQQAISSILLSDSDRQRIDSLVAENMNKIKRGASMTLASVNALIQRASIQSNMPSREEDSKEGKPAVKQEPIPSEFGGMFVEPMRPSAMLVEKMPTASELEAIKSNSAGFVLNVSKMNLTLIKRLQEEYRRRNERNRSLAGSTSSNSTVGAIVKELRTNGVSAFTDKGGHRWSLINYCSMVTRTASTESDNVGEVYADEGHDLYYVVPHGGSCPLCAKVEGKVYSRSGTNPNYPPLASIFSKIDPNGTDDLSNTYMTIHPNCRHRIIKYVEKNHG